MTPDVRTALSNLLWRVRRPQLASSFAIESHLTGRERAKLFDLARMPQIRAIVEIGSLTGASATAFASGLLDGGSANGRVYCIDTWHNDAMSEGRRDTFSTFRANTARYQELIVPVRGWSTEVAPFIARTVVQADILFIDGDHSYEGCLADWRAYSSLLSPGAFVVLHDIGWADGVQRVINSEIRPRIKREAQLPNMWWAELA